MLSWPKLEVFFGWARAGIDIVVDDVSIKPLQIDNDCLQLVKNGDAEVGDARHWFLRGSGDYGTISIESGGAGGSAYAFHHKGTRSRINQGIWQELDKSCMPLNSEWKIYSSFKFFDKDGTPTDCYNQNSATCVKWRVESYNGDGKQIFGKHLDNDKIDKGEWVVDSWNDYESTFTISKQFDDRERIFIYVVAPIGYTYMVDNIRVLKSGSSDQTLEGLYAATNNEINGNVTSSKASKGGGKSKSAKSSKSSKSGSKSKSAKLKKTSKSGSKSKSAKSNKSSKSGSKSKSVKST